MPAAGACAYVLCAAPAVREEEQREREKAEGGEGKIKARCRVPVFRRRGLATAVNKGGATCSVRAGEGGAASCACEGDDRWGREQYGQCKISPLLYPSN